MRSLWVCIFSIGISPGCSEPTGSHLESSTLPEGIVARVGEDEISTELAREVAGSQGVSKTDARDLLIGDALFAAYAREEFRGTGLVESAERAALARATLSVLQEEARAQGAPTDAEIGAIVSERWSDYDRPALARTKHVVVVVESKDQEAKAKRVADSIAKAVSGVKDPDEFEQRAKSVPTEGLQVRVEQLDPVAPDGRVVVHQQLPPGAPEPRYDKDFARAATDLETVGSQSPVIRSKYGFHVILLLEKLPAIHYPRQQLSKLLEHEVIDQRARRLHQALLERIKKSTAVVTGRATNDYLMRVPVSDEAPSK